MLDKLKQVEDRYEELCARAEQPDFYADPKKAAAWLREQKELAPFVAAYRAYCAAPAGYAGCGGADGRADPTLS